MAEPGWLDLVRLAIGGLACVLGAVMALASGIGAVRLRDVFARAHAISAWDGAATVLLGVGLAIVAWDLRFGVILAVIVAARLVIAPALAPAILQAARREGEPPISRVDP